MMICLLRNLGGLKHLLMDGINFHIRMTRYPGADLATLKWYRNQMAHASVTSMDNNEFAVKWTHVEKALTSLNKGQIPNELTEILNYDLDGENAKRLAIAELEQLKKEYLECEKEKEQLESDFMYYKEGNLPKHCRNACHRQSYLCLNYRDKRCHSDVDERFDLYYPVLLRTPPHTSPLIIPSPEEGKTAMSTLERPDTPYQTP
ncbi:unnamed protein product [Mytilus edulis]|uniref:DZIP3-like HEPN domain-containing protein n=1 Tax=Mytilus edulis TaxID=6550 RepID=A0A8S3QJ56_MYTED|nr:unnamed protein product [Mytilus edulis]